jgi:hypothetical protein
LATYGEESKLINGKGDQEGSYKAGTKQGDTLSMIYFCLVMGEATSRIEERLREIQMEGDFKVIKMMYADDFTLFGNPSFLIENFNIIVEEFAKVGLEVQPSEMKLLLTNDSITPDDTFFRTLRITIRHNTMTIKWLIFNNFFTNLQ